MGILGKIFGPKRGNPAFESLIKQIRSESYDNLSYYRTSDSPAFQGFLREDLGKILSFYMYLVEYSGSIAENEISHLRYAIINSTGKKIFNLANFAQLLQMLRSFWPKAEEWYSPLDQILKQIENRWPENPEHKQELLALIEDCLADPHYGQNTMTGYYTAKSHVTRINRMLTLRGKITGKEISGDVDFKFAGDDSFAESTTKYMASLSAENRSALIACMRLGLTASSSAPNKKFTSEITQIFAPLNKNGDALLSAMLQLIIDLKPLTDRPVNAYNPLLHNANDRMARALIWAAAIRQIDAIKAPYEKIALFFGPESVLLTNAALYALSAIPGNDGFAALSRLRRKLKQRNFRTIIEKYLAEAARKRGISVSELEDSLASDFGLRQGKVALPVGSVKAEISVAGATATLIWKNKAGTTLKTIPPEDKQGDAAGFKKAKTTLSEINKNLTVQKARFDNYLRDYLELPFAGFEKRFLNHGLLGCIARGLIWNFKDGKKSHQVFWREDAWRDVKGKEVTPTSESLVSLWHPVEENTKEITTWREFMVKHEIRQPVKQAFREVYALTPPEAATRVYSNRMAAHIIRQYQFHALARDRGYRYTMAGNFDHGSNLMATLDLTEKKLQAQFWVNEIHDATAPADSIMQPYVATDQVKFVSLENREPVPLANIPLRLFSEIMRDVDMFVGVCSVGNDPNWRDSGGVRTFDAYWESYAFGELSQVAVTRRDALVRLLPSLRIADKCTLQEKFLRVQGTKTAYKIHLGSTNILMEPDDRYLCIVPAQGDSGAKKIFLPFDDDRGLSLVLSKAFLLAADDKIKDETILQQIKRK